MVHSCIKRGMLQGSTFYRRNVLDRPNGATVMPFLSTLWTDPLRQQCDAKGRSAREAGHLRDDALMCSHREQ